MLRTFEPQNRAKSKNAEAEFKNTCSYKMKSVYMIYTRSEACEFNRIKFHKQGRILMAAP